MSAQEFEIRASRLVDEERYSQRTVVWLLAQLLALTFNIHRKPDSPAREAEDFVPGLTKHPTPDEPPAPASGADAVAFLKGL
jgi:hypothetical protein